MSAHLHGNRIHLDDDDDWDEYVAAEAELGADDSRTAMYPAGWLAGLTRGQLVAERNKQHEIEDRLGGDIEAECRSMLVQSEIMRRGE